MGFLIDDLIANIVSTITNIWSMLPGVAQLVIGVALVGLLLGVFQAVLFTLSDSGMASAQSLRATLTLGRLCDNETGYCEITYQPFFMSSNMTYEFQRIGKNSTEVQLEMDGCIERYKQAAWDMGPLQGLTFTCDCNASTYNFTGFPPAASLECTGIPDGFIWTNCETLGLVCYEDIASNIYDSRENEIETGFYLLDAQFWFLVGMLAPVGKFAMEWYASSKAI